MGAVLEIVLWTFVWLLAGLAVSYVFFGSDC